MSKRLPSMVQGIKEDIEKMQPFEIEPPDKYKTGKAKRYYEKQCFKKAYDYMINLDPDGGILVQGLYTKWSIPHSWVELPGDIVFDGVLQRFYNKQDYYREQKAVKVVEFTLKQACQEARRTRNIGKWFD